MSVPAAVDTCLRVVVSVVKVGSVCEILFAYLYESVYKSCRGMPYSIKARVEARNEAMYIYNVSVLLFKQPIGLCA